MFNTSIGTETGIDRKKIKKYLSSSSEFIYAALNKKYCIKLDKYKKEIIDLANMERTFKNKGIMTERKKLIRIKHRKNFF